MTDIKEAGKSGMNRLETIRRNTAFDTLVKQIMKGNVVPVLGNDMVKIDGVTSHRFLLDAVSTSGLVEVQGSVSSFMSLMRCDTLAGADGPKILHGLVSSVIEEKAEMFKPTDILYKFLSIKYFPFVITTTIDPVIENTMRKIHGDKLRVMAFVNDPVRNQDIRNSLDTVQPTLYYMFGKANNKSDEDFVLTETDLLRFSRSWLLPTDSNSKAKPANLSNALANKYLLVLGNNFQDWLFRFFWLAMKDKKLTYRTNVPNGMDASEHSDERLIEFLNFSNIISRTEDLPEFVDELIRRLDEAEPESDADSCFSRPVMNADVFISYSRADSDVAMKLYDIMTARGLNVWFDKRNLGIADDFKQEIRKAIRTCKLFVPILSDNITKQAREEHIYRLEWDWAIEHKRVISPAVKFIVPLAERSFDMYDNMAGIKDEIKSHNAAFYSKAKPEPDLSEFVDSICEIIKSK